MEIAQVLQPRFLGEDAQGRDLNPTGLWWLLPARDCSGLCFGKTISGFLAFGYSLFSFRGGLYHHFGGGNPVVGYAPFARRNQVV